MAGEVWLERGMTAAVLGSMARVNTAQGAHAESGKIARLTERERDVVALVCEGLRNKQVAERLYISDTTARHHMTAIFAKLAVSDRLELVSNWRCTPTGTGWPSPQGSCRSASGMPWHK